jgi:threonylcarbamoyladenosine tRNA methylthiotransferase MtaB
VQVQNGCDSFCSYCIVPFARGRSRSVQAAAVLDEIALLVAKGFREVVLTGIHLGVYGRELSPPMSFLSLLEAIERQTSVPRLRIGSLDPQDITPDFIDFLATSRIICPHLHIPLQSGSGTVLSRMNRHYDGPFVRGLVCRLVAAMPDIAIGFDVIAGFPGESEEEFAETVDLIEELPVAYLHVFPFSSRPGTKAAMMTGHLPDRVVSRRAAALRTLGVAKKRAFLERFVGRELDVLVQQRGPDRLWRGLSGNYLIVSFPADGDLANRLARVRILGGDGEILAGVLTEV